MSLASSEEDLLDSIRFLRDIAKPGGGLQQAIVQGGGVSKIRCLAARKEPAVEIDVELKNGADSPTWRYALGFTQQLRGHRLATRENAYGTQYLQTYADRVWTDNLLSLTECR